MGARLGFLFLQLKTGRKKKLCGMRALGGRRRTWGLWQHRAMGGKLILGEWLGLLRLRKKVRRKSWAERRELQMRQGRGDLGRLMGMGFLAGGKDVVEMLTVLTGLRFVKGKFAGGGCARMMTLEA